MAFKLKTNKKLLPLKAYYFLWSGGAFTMLSFVPVYAKQLGYSSFVLGIVCAVCPLFGMLLKPLMGAIADKYHCRKLLFLIFQVVATTAFFSMVFLPEIPTTAKVRFTCDGPTVVLEKSQYDGICELSQGVGFFDKDVLCNLTCPFEPQHWEIVCNYWTGEKRCITHPAELSVTASLATNFTNDASHCSYSVKGVAFENGSRSYPNCPGQFKISTICNIQCESTLVQPTSDDAHIIIQYQFWLILLAYLVAWTSQAVTNSIGDAVCSQMLEDKPQNYGYQRMWGAVGCGILSIMAGFLVDSFSESETKKDYSAIYVTGTAMLVVCVVVSSRIQYTQQQISARILKGIGRLLSAFRIWIFMIFCMCVGISTALTWNFLFWHLEDLAANHGPDMQANMKTIEGLILGIQCLGGDLPFLFLSSRIFKWIGHVHTMSFILLVIGVKFLLYSLLSNPWWCLPIEFLNGPTYGLFCATMTSYASIVAPAGMEATTQGLVGALFEGVGLSLGSLMGGVLFQEFGGSMTFRIFGLSVVIVFLLHLGVSYLMKNVPVRDKDSLQVGPT